MPFQRSGEELAKFFSQLELVIAESWAMLVGEDSVLRTVDRLSFDGEQVFSTLEICFEQSYVMTLNIARKTAEKLAEYFYGEPVDELEELMETVGEALNIFAGNFMGLLPPGWKMKTPSYEIIDGYQPRDGFYSQSFHSSIGGFHLAIFEA